MSENELVYPGGMVRLYVEGALGEDARIVPDEGQAHYLLHVMRGRADDRVRLFNGRDGEWLARLTELSKRSCVLLCERRLASQADVPDLWLVFAPVKKTPMDYVAQKATELGVRRLQPVLTRRTIVARVNLERLRANAVEAAEQSGRLTVPEIGEPAALSDLLAEWPKDRSILFCDEGGDAPPIAETLRSELSGRWAVLTGPEGGFDPVERSLIRNHAQACPVSLGARILRADTAALAALAVWQAIKGDWQR